MSEKTVKIRREYEDGTYDYIDQQSLISIILEYLKENIPEDLWVKVGKDEKY
jgi:hypothetical protein